MRRLPTKADALAATDGDPFVAHDVPEPIDRDGWTLGSAVVIPRRTRTRRLGAVVMGEPHDVAALVVSVRGTGWFDDEAITGVTVDRPLLTIVAELLPLTDEGGEWEWMCTTTEPPPVPGEDRLVELTHDHLDDVRGLLAVANERTDARPFETPDQAWVGVRDSDGRLVACGVRDTTLAGSPILEGITVHPGHRGTGLGVAVTARLTRDAVRASGVCTLGMYSDNDVARRVYHGLGYASDHVWSSRRLAR